MERGFRATDNDVGRLGTFRQTFERTEFACTGLRRDAYLISRSNEEP